MFLWAERKELGQHLETGTDMGVGSLDLRLRYLKLHPVIKCPLTLLSVNGM